MKDRCYRQGNKLYRRYGGRGIEVCSEWRESFSLFRSWAERAGYRKGLEIDRIDNNGHYAPDNCRWTTKQANARNKSTNRMLTAYGETKTMMDWSEDPRCEVNYYTLRSRIYISGWEVEEALKRKPLRADKSA